MLRRLIGLYFIILMVSCRYRGIPEDIFRYPIYEGMVWYYEEKIGDTLSVIDSIVVIKDTSVIDSIVVIKDTVYTYKSQTVQAWKVQKSHESASQGKIIVTNITFIYNNSIMEILPVQGLFPDSILYNNQWLKFKYNEDSVVVKWLPLIVKPGDEWEMAMGSGVVKYGSLECPMSITIVAKSQGYETVQYTPLDKRFVEDTLLYDGNSLHYSNALKVEYSVKTNMCVIPIESVLLTVWWKSGIGAVKNDVMGYPSNLITHLVGWKRP